MQPSLQLEESFFDLVSVETVPRHMPDPAGRPRVPAADHEPGAVGPAHTADDELRRPCRAGHGREVGAAHAGPIDRRRHAQEVTAATSLAGGARRAG